MKRFKVWIWLIAIGMAPVLSIHASAMDLDWRWQNPLPPGSCTLVFAPNPDADLTGSFDRGNRTGVSAPLMPGNAYYAANQTCNNAGQNDISNIEFFVIPKPWEKRERGEGKAGEGKSGKGKSGITEKGKAEKRKGKIVNG